MDGDKLPYGWSLVRLGEVSLPIDSIDPSNQPDEEFTYVDIASIDNRLNLITSPKTLLGRDAPARARQLIRSGDVLFSTVRTYLKNIALVTSEYDGEVCSTGFCVIRASAAVNPKFIFFNVLTNQFISNVTPTQTGILYPATKDSIIFNQLVPLPPLAEQERIVTKIDTLFQELGTARQALQNVPSLLKQLYQSILAKAFRGGLTERDPNDEQLVEILESRGTPNVIQSNSDLPREWVSCRIGDICTTTSGGTPLRSRSDYYGGKIPWLKSGELEDGLVTNTQETITELGLRNSNAKVFPKGTVVIALYGATVGRTGILDLDTATNQAVCAVFQDSTLLNRDYLFHYLNSIRDNLMKQSFGGAQPNISQAIVRAVVIPIAPMKEQLRIVAKISEALSSTSNIELALSEGTKHTERIEQSILERAFRGELVSQDPNDEPAAELLQRTKAKSVLPKVPGGPRRRDSNQR